MKSTNNEVSLSDKRFTINDENGINIQFIPSNRKKTKKISVFIENEITIKNVNKLFSIINENIKDYNQIDLNITNINKIDLSAIQCLYVIKENQLRNNKIITIDSDLNKEFKNMLIDSGFQKLITKPKLTS